ncbi:MAG: hypothetical protein ACXVQJ_04770 [Actinomycetota bacterium]
MRLKRPLRSVVLLASIAVLTGSAALAVPPAGAVPRAPASRVLNPGPLIHLLPTRGVARSLQAGLAPPPSLQYWGGPVMQPGTKTIPIFWEPPTLQDGITPVNVSATYHTFIDRFLGDLGGHGFYSSLTQYYEKICSAKKYIVNASSTPTSLTVTSPYPTPGGACSGHPNCVTDAQIQAKLASVVTKNGLPVNGSTIYLLFTAPLEESCYDATDCFAPVTQTHFVYCAYHSAFYPARSARPVIYANMPYLESNTASINGCSSGAAHPNDAAFDDETPTLGHELAEAITDPLPGASLAPPTAWVDPNTGNEIADICDTATSATSVTWGANTYEVSPDWSNATSSCVTGGAQAVSTSPGSGLPGSSTTLTGSGFAASEQVTLSFVDASGTVFPLGTTAASGGAISQSVQLPAAAKAGKGTLEAIGGTPEDGASAPFTVLGPPFRPDALLGRAKTGPFTGNGIYSATGAKETLVAKVQNGRQTTFWVEVQNDGSSADTVSLRGAGPPKGFTVGYHVGAKDVSSAVRAGTYRKRLDPKASFLLKVVVGVRSSTAPGRVFHAKVAASSVADGTKMDAVVAAVTSA